MTNKIIPSQYVLIDDWLSSGSGMMSDDPVIKNLALFFAVFRMPARKKAKYIKLLQFNKPGPELIDIVEGGLRQSDRSWPPNFVFQRSRRTIDAATARTT